MRNSKVTQKLNELQWLIERTSQATEDISLQKHWGRYLCVMAGGFLEYGLKTIYSDFAASASSPHVANFVSQRLARVANPNAQRFVGVARSFNQSWGEQLEEYLGNGPGSRKDALDSIMSNRNQIAHGGDVGISVHRVRELLARSIPVLEFIEDQCDGHA